MDEALKKASLLEVYDSVVVPALSLLQQHRQQDDVDETFAGVVVQNARDVVEELNEEYAGPAEAHRMRGTNLRRTEKRGCRRWYAWRREPTRMRL